MAAVKDRFDVDALRNLAGEKVFVRGKSYHRDGQVEIIVVEPRRVVAQVAGTDDYRVELTGKGKTIDGECSCPAFEDWGFCKHMVATALAANDAGDEAEATGAGTLPRIRDHLRALGVDALAEMILELAERDPALFRKLDLAATASRADDKTIESQMRKAIDTATRTRGFIEYHEAPGWAAEVDAVLDSLASLIPAGRAGIALSLAPRALDRIEQAAGNMDDSDGYCGGLMERARDIHLAAAEAVRPEPVKLARDLFALEMESDFSFFDGAVALYAEALGEKGLAEYRRLAAAAWAKLPPRAAGRGLDTDSGDYRHVAAMLDFFAERDGDVDARIALRAKDLSSPWSYLQLAEFCRAQERDQEALRWAEEGLWVFEDGRTDERLLFFTCELLEKAGRKNDAEVHLRKTFEKQPSLELYARLRKLAGKTVCEWAVRLLETRLAAHDRTPWHSPELLIRILMKEKLFDAAWGATRKYTVSLAAREALATATEATHPREAIETYVRRVDQLADQGGNPAYAEAAKLIRRMAGLRSAAEQAAYLTGLKARFGRKRNFMKLLA